MTSLRAAVPHGKKVLLLCRSGQRSIAAAKRATELGMEAYNVLEGFEGDPDDRAQRGRKGGWRLHGLPWRQGSHGNSIRRPTAAVPRASLSAMPPIYGSFFADASRLAPAASRRPRYSLHISSWLRP